jgi:hypothetical protein
VPSRTIRRFIRSAAVAALAISAYAQTAQLGPNAWDANSKREAEDAVAKEIDYVRASAKRPALARVSPSIMDVQLVCTAALTGHKEGDPIFGGLETYQTNDPSAETATLKQVTLELPKKKWPRYSVVVERSANSTPEGPAYLVGVARRPSALTEFFAPLMFDVPFKGMNEWKKRIASECRNRKD